MKSSLLSIIIVLASFSYAYTQPCLNGWKHRRAILINNTQQAQTLTNYQVKINLNTRDLIAQGKAKLDGADIRFLNKQGSVLPYWIVTNTFNTTNTEIWVKVDNILAAATDTIYMYYGEPSALPLSNGDLVFELFDDFIGSTLNTNKWEVCNEASLSVAGGSIQFNSNTLATGRNLITSKSTVNGQVICEAMINQVTAGVGIFGQQTATNQGYAMAYDVDGQPAVRMVNIVNDANCKNIQNPLPPNNFTRSAGATQGLWRFRWTATAQQFYAWPGFTNGQAASDANLAFLGATHITLGNLNKNGSLSADWVRVRKYLANEPTLSLQEEVTSVFTAIATNNSPTCVGTSLQLNANTVLGANYSWTGPDNFTSNEQNPVIPSVSEASAGTYQVTVSLPAGCSSAQATTTVEIDPVSISGTLTGNATLCIDQNNGVVRLSNYRGAVKRWESSFTGNAPWTAIALETDTLAYANLLQTTHYRAIVGNGVCENVISNAVKIQIDNTTNAGEITGAGAVCKGDSIGLRLINQIGTITSWQYRTNPNLPWQPFVSQQAQNLPVKPLNESIWVKAMVKNGVCVEKSSDSVRLTADPIPQPNFTVEEVCKGIISNFVNTSTIASGAITNYQWEFGLGQSSSGNSPSFQFNTPGSHPVTLIARSNKGCADTITKNAVVHHLPDVNFTVEDVCYKFTSRFTNLTTIPVGSVVDYMWNFGENDEGSPMVSPTYKYNTAGKYRVVLTATSDQLCVDSLVKETNIHPRAQLGFLNDTIFLGENARFTNTSTIINSSLSYEWRFGDGNTSALNNPEHRYTNSGTFQVVLISTSLEGCKDTLSKPQVVNADAKADFVVNNECLYDSLRFENRSFITTGTLTYEWDFGDGTASTLDNPAHIYESAGIYNVRLTATSDQGSVSTIAKNITVFPLPRAVFTGNDRCLEESIQFANTSAVSSGSLSYQWNFGDNNTSTEFRPSHVYAIDGTYTVELIVTTDKNCKDTSYQQITVYPLPQPAYTVNDACDGLPSLFQDTTKINSGSIVEWLWDFGDGTNSIEQHPVKQFLNPRIYTVSLRAISDKNCIRSVSKPVKVVKAPVADFDFENVCFRDIMNFTDRSISEEGQIFYHWDFGDGRISESSSPSHLYNRAIYFDVTLSIVSEFGCKDSITQTVQVYELPVVKVSSDTATSKGFPVQLLASGGKNYLWQPSAGLSNQGVFDPIATPEATTRYVVSVIDSNGCRGSAGMTLEIIDDYKLIVNNVITPDGNGINDEWRVQNIESYPETRVRVFDRWGKIVFEQTAYQNDWQGVSGNDILPGGEYYYVITFESTNKIYKGTLTIIR